MWHPDYTITSEVARDLMRIEAARTAVDHTPLSLAAAEELRRLARLRSTHYSTRIEGNRLTLEEAGRVVAGQPIDAPGRERDIREVQNYWNAFIKMEKWEREGQPLSEELIQKLHALVEVGPRAKPTPYRDGQNVIRNSRTGAIVYLPPAAHDVPCLMAELVAWCSHAVRTSIPVPLIAGLTHYQFATIHPYFDGNGRTARLLTTFLLHRGGYGLNGIFSLEEFHAQDLDAYYGALVTHPHHNYYESRAVADLTPWLRYFCATLARVFTLAQREAMRAAGVGPPADPEALRRLDLRARRVVAMFAKKDSITASEIAGAFGFSDRAARNLLIELVAQGVIEVRNPSRRARVYGLSEVYRKFIGSLSEVH